MNKNRCPCCGQIHVQTIPPESGCKIHAQSKNFAPPEKGVSFGKPPFDTNCRCNTLPPVDVDWDAYADHQYDDVDLD